MRAFQRHVHISHAWLPKYSFVCSSDYTGHKCTVRLKVIGNEMIKNVGKYESCMVSKVPIIFKRTRTTSSQSTEKCHTFHAYARSSNIYVISRSLTDRVHIRVRLHIIRNERIENVGKSQSCMVENGRLIPHASYMMCSDARRFVVVAAAPP